MNEQLEEKVIKLQSRFGDLEKEYHRLRAIDRLDADFTGGYGLATAPKIEIYISDLGEADRQALLDTVRMAVLEYKNGPMKELSAHIQWQVDHIGEDWQPTQPVAAEEGT